jgi:tetratricopeptide (TPR) repeat protein
LSNEARDGRLNLAAVLLFATALTVNLPVYALDDESSVGYFSAGYRPVTNDQFIRDDNNPTTYLFRAEMAIQRRQWDQAIIFLRKSIKANDDDIDTHKCLAVCLEQKLEEQEDKNGPIYKECLNEWLIVMRNMKGAEKGLSKKNGSSPTNNQKWEDEEGAGMARTHILKLTGLEPKQRESNSKFIARVTKTSEQNVSATVLKSHTQKSVLDQ